LLLPALADATNVPSRRAAEMANPAASFADRWRRGLVSMMRVIAIS
jgi:hypothetical protein